MSIQDISTSNHNNATENILVDCDVENASLVTIWDEEGMWIKATFSETMRTNEKTFHIR